GDRASHSPARLVEERLRSQHLTELLRPVVASDAPGQSAEPGAVAAGQDDRRPVLVHIRLTPRRLLEVHAGRGTAYAGASARVMDSRSAMRARWRRDFTVVPDSPSASAASSLESPSTSRRTRTARYEPGSVASARSSAARASPAISSSSGVLDQSASMKPR